MGRLSERWRNAQRGLAQARTAFGRSVEDRGMNPKPRREARLHWLNGVLQRIEGGQMDECLVSSKGRVACATASFACLLAMTASTVVGRAAVYDISTRTCALAHAQGVTRAPERTHAPTTKQWRGFSCTRQFSSKRRWQRCAATAGWDNCVLKVQDGLVLVDGKLPRRVWLGKCSCRIVCAMTDC